MKFSSFLSTRVLAHYLKANTMLLFIILSVYGLAEANPNKFIVGGREVYPAGLYPFQGYLEIDGIGGPSFTCGCVLVDTDVVLTAAHCVDGEVETPNRVLMVFGAHDRETNLQGDPETYIAQSIYIHPNQTGVPADGYPNDIAVIRLVSPVNLDNAYIAPIPLPESGRVPEDWLEKECMISGWGRLEGGITGDLANVLQHAEVDVLTEAECRVAWTDDQIHDDHVCLYDRAGRSVSGCNGDSGGPCVCESEPDVWELVGLTSWGNSDCDPSFPSVYVRVSEFRDWIDEVLSRS